MAAHFLEVQGACRLKHTIPPGAPQGYRDYTRSPYCCRCQSPHNAGEPWTLHALKHSWSSQLVTDLRNSSRQNYLQPGSTYFVLVLKPYHVVFIDRWGPLVCHRKTDAMSVTIWSSTFNLHWLTSAAKWRHLFVARVNLWRFLAQCLRRNSPVIKAMQTGTRLLNWEGGNARRHRNRW